MAKKIHALLLGGQHVESKYYYHYWTANQKNQIHKGHCGECQFGFGKRNSQNRGKHGMARII